jgi:spermidine synthase
MRFLKRKGSSPARRRRIVFAPVTFSEESGIRYLHFGTEWIQGAMRLSAPDVIELEYAQQMMMGLLFAPDPRRAVQLGLGAGALTKFCFRNLPEAEVVAVELNPDVVTAARTMFRLPEDNARLTVLQGDAQDFVMDPVNHGAIDVLQIDLYDAAARGPVLDSEEFYRGCRMCLRAPGTVTVNLFGEHPSFAKNQKTLQAAFDGRVVILPEVHQGNRVAIAFEGPPLDVSFADLYQRADEIGARYGLPARSWVHGLRECGLRHTQGGRFRV